MAGGVELPRDGLAVSYGGFVPTGFMDGLRSMDGLDNGVELPTVGLPISGGGFVPAGYWGVVRSEVPLKALPVSGGVLGEMFGGDTGRGVGTGVVGRVGGGDILGVVRSTGGLKALPASGSGRVESRGEGGGSMTVGGRSLRDGNGVVPDSLGER